MFRKNKKVILGVLLSILILDKPFISKHRHDESCGYDIKTGSGCIYTLDNDPIIKPFEEKDPGN